MINKNTSRNTCANEVRIGRELPIYPIPTSLHRLIKGGAELRYFGKMINSFCVCEATTGKKRNIAAVKNPKRIIYTKKAAANFGIFRYFCWSVTSGSRINPKSHAEKRIRRISEKLLRNPHNNWNR